MFVVDFFFFKQNTAYEWRISDWSSDVCSSDLMGNHMAVTVGGLQGHLELNVFKPLIAYNVLQSIRLLSDAAMSFADRAVAGLEPDRERIAALLEQSLM